MGFNFKNHQVKDIVLDLFKCKLKCTNLSDFLKTEAKDLENIIIKYRKNSLW